jgi:cell division protein ZapA
MSESKPISVEVSILGKEFLVACPQEQREDLVRAAEFLSNRMSEIKRSGKVVGTDRIAIMAALNISYELLKGEPILESAVLENERISDRLEKLNEKVSLTLQQVNAPVA